MLETLMTSKIRAVLVRHFVEHRGERFYLRQLERLLPAPLTPLRRELIRLTQMGLLKEEPEGNLKFYRLNLDFGYLEELEKLAGADSNNRHELHPSNEMAGSKWGRSWILPALGLLILQVGLFFLWTHFSALHEPTKRVTTPDSYVMSSNQVKLESGGLGGWQ